jgi:hypothetical protein
MKRFIVCGGRDFQDKECVAIALNIVKEKHPDFILVHGACCGADYLGREWAEENDIVHEPHPANWQKLNRAAGPIRNTEMLDAGADGVVAFPGGKGTANMMQQAKDRKVIVWRIPEDFKLKERHETTA